MKNYNVPLALWELDPEGFHIVVKGRLQGKRIRLLIDTGANHSCFDKSLIETISISDEEMEKDEVNIGIGGSNFQTEIANITDLKVGRMPVEKLTTRLLDISEINEMYVQMGFKRIHGILGGDFLHRYEAVIDYPNQTLILKK